MIKVSDRLTLMMTLDSNKEWPIERFMFQSLQISENVLLHVPQAHFVFADREALLQKFPLGDGQTVHIVIKVSGSSTPAYDIKMRVFKLSKVSSGNIDYYNLYLVYDAPRFLYENFVGCLSGQTSTAALGEIANNCGLTLTASGGTDASDSQTWIPRGEKYCSFARHIVAAAYSSTTSCMQIAVNFSGKLIYRNLSQAWYGENRQQPLTFSSVPSGSTLKLLAYKEFTKSGLMNAFGGYKMSTVEQNPTKGKSTSQSQHSKVSTVTKTDSVAINKNINEGISGSRVDFSPINCGNNHDNYDLAVHQNSRLLGMYSVGMYLVTDDVNPGITLLQTVKLNTPEIANGKRGYNKTIAGEWEVSGKTLFINRAGQFFEKYEVLRQGTNNMANNSTQSGTAA